MKSDNHCEKQHCSFLVVVGGNRPYNLPVIKFDLCAMNCGHGRKYFASSHLLCESRDPRNSPQNRCPAPLKRNRIDDYAYYTCGTEW
jgi:hypothetical protein